MPILGPPAEADITGRRFTTFIRTIVMKTLKSMLLMMSLLGCAALVGCSEKSSATKSTTVETPNGETTTETTVEVEKSGENPPPAQQ